MQAYEGTPAGMVHRMLEDPSRLRPGDPGKMVQIMIESVDREPARSGSSLGSDAFTAIHGALTDRPAVLEGQRELAFSTVFPTEG
jgi:hypothetical protein